MRTPKPAPLPGSMPGHVSGRVFSAACSAMLPLLLVLAAAVTAAPRPATADDALPPERPRVGLVLGGGGAKGAAHIGVLRVLDELRVPVDCVVGTSMGALVGAPLAAGMTPERIESIVRGTDWSRTVGGQGQRRRTPIQEKLSVRSYTNTLEIGVSGRGLTTPSGLLRTQYIEDMIRDLISSGRLTTDFDDLSIPFRAIATDMVEGEMVVLESGDLSLALRASMAVPGVFAPVTRNGQVLADGGMMRNLPVDIARDFCADVVIAVWVSTPQPGPDELGSAVSLLGRALDVMVIANQNEQIASLTPQDVGIEVPMDEITAGDFHRVPEAIDLGRAAAEAMRGSLLRYAVPEAQYARWRDSLTREGGARTLALAEVRVQGLERVNEGYVRAQLYHAVPGTKVTLDQIAADTDRIFALDDFERVSYEVHGPPGARVLTIAPREKPWGPDYLRFDLGLTANEPDDLQGLLRADYTRTWLNRRGGEWHSALQVGQQSLLQTDFYQPLDVGQRFFVQPIARIESDLQDVFLGEDRIATYRLTETWGQLDLGMNLGTRAQLRAGLRHGQLDVDVDTGFSFLPEIDDLGESAIVLGGIYDTRDAVALPTRGTYMNLRYLNSGAWLGGEQDYELVEAVYSRAFDWRGDSLSLTLGGGAGLSGDLPPNRQFLLGGIRTFPGLRPGELRGSGYWFAGTSYYWRVAEISPLFGQALYAGLRLHAGRPEKRLDGIDEETVYGLAGSLVGRTPFGPVLISLGYADDGRWQLQFGLGRPVSEGSLLDETH